MFEALVIILLTLFGYSEADMQGKSLDDLKVGPEYDQAKQIYYEQEKDGGITVTVLGG